MVARLATLWTHQVTGPKDRAQGQLGHCAAASASEYSRVVHRFRRDRVSASVRLTAATYSHGRWRRHKSAEKSAPSAWVK